MIENKKIFLIIPTMMQGGAERVMSLLADAFAKKNHQVHLVLLANSVDFYKLAPEVIIHRLHFQKSRRFKKIFQEIKILYKLRTLIKEHKPDTALSFMEKSNILTIIASLFLTTDVFISDRSNPLKKSSYVLSLLKKQTYPHATGIIAQTEKAKEIILKKKYNKNIKVIANPIREVKLFPEIQKEKIIINVGRFVHEKGQTHLLEIFKNLNLADWKLAIIGDGPLRAELLNKAKELKIDKQIILPGTVYNVDEWLAKASIFAFSSISEGFPNALLEAMAAGLPSISFDCYAGPRDIIRDGQNGFLIDVLDIKRFENRIQLLIENDGLRTKLGNNGMAVRDINSLSNISNEFLQFFIKQT